MSNEIKAALHVAMEAIDAKLRNTGLKPGHENDLRAAKGFLRSMISNLPAASGQQEDLSAAILRIPCAAPEDIKGKGIFVYYYENGLRDGLRKAAELAAVHPAPAQQESAWRPLNDVQWMNIVNHDHVYESFSKEDAVHEAVKRTEAKLRENNEGRAPAQAALTVKPWHERMAEYYNPAEGSKRVRGDVFFKDEEIAELRAALATASAAPAEQVRDAGWISVADRLPEPWTEVMVWPHPSDYCMTAELRSDGIWQYGEYVHHHGHENVKMPDGRIEYWAPLLAAPDASQQKGGV